MKQAFSFRSLALGLALLLPLPVLAFPPAPHHTLFGMVRDEYGTPLNVQDAELIFETLSGSKLTTTVIPNLEPGANYRLLVPMDSGVTADAYKPTAMKPTAAFRIKVRIGNRIYLPMEMSGDFSQLGSPGRSTRLNLTLGEDTDGDGLPDAWERLINSDLSKVRPGDDADGDGLSNVNEYLAGTYALDPSEGFNLTIKGFNNGAPVLEFLAVKDHTYTVLGSADLKTWAPLTFRVPAEGAEAAARGTYSATDVRPLQVEVVTATGQPAPKFFRLMAQ